MQLATPGVHGGPLPGEPSSIPYTFYTAPVSLKFAFTVRNMGNASVLQRMYNLMGGARVQDNDFSNLFWPRHQVSLGEISTWFAHFANLVSCDF